MRFSYAHDAGLVRDRLDGFDTPRTYRDDLPPRALPWPTVLQLLRSIECTNRAGWRDLCILHLIAYYGLRPGEVVALRLDSIDWERELLHVYRLRHTFAMRLLARGVGMKAIGDVLGHHSFYGTSAYLRLDVTMLRSVALAVPGRAGGRHA